LAIINTVNNREETTMTDYDVKIPGQLVSSLMTEKSGFADLLEVMLNQVLEAQVSEQIGADRYQRTEDRGAYRNGSRPRQLVTRVGPITLRIPQLRDGVFSTEIFRRYQRSEQALVLAMMEMVVNGVSTRKVTKITEELCGASFSKSTVSQLCTALDARVAAFNERRLGSFPFLIIDAMYLKTRTKDDGVVSQAALMVSGVNMEGFREVLGVKIGDSESAGFWTDVFRWLKERGLKDVAFIVSDDHSGLTAAARRCFQGAILQRCQVHFMRNVLSHTPARHKTEIGEGLKRIFAAENAPEARQRFGELAQKMKGKAKNAIECLEAGLEDALAVLALPKRYRQRLRTSNMQERLIREVRRRERVICIFPNEASALRMIGAVLAEINEDWQNRRYLDMAEFKEWKAERDAQKKNQKVIEI
jgi:transposase-like protein